jgi:hypothetical protein
MIRFSGVDIVLHRRLGADPIRRGIAAALSVETAKVSVIDDVAHYPERAAADVVCVTTAISGDFAEVVSIQCEPKELPFASILEVVQRESSALGTAVLAPDDGPDPYVMWLVQPHLAPRQVSLDAAAFEDDRYEILDARNHA